MKRAIWVLALFFLTGAGARADILKLAVTTSFDNSGLADILLPEIRTETGIDVQLLVVGTGQALRLGRAGDVDAILVHSKSAEEQFVADGFGTHRRNIMYNDFVIVGPSDDPAGISGAQSAAEALTAIAASKSIFVSRGDDSGTHKKELSLWADTAFSPGQEEEWFKAVGAGMGAALNTASGLDAYILADRASWLNFGNKGNLRLLFAGDPALFNQYAYLPVSPDTHPHVRSGLAEELETWLVSERAEQLINRFMIDGENLFVFNAVR